MKGEEPSEGRGGKGATARRGKASWPGPLRSSGTGREGDSGGLPEGQFPWLSHLFRAEPKQVGVGSSTPGSAGPGA